jgi:transglutaminase superfamily protein
VRALQKFAALPPRRRALVLKASFVVAGYRLALTTLPFRWVRSGAARTGRAKGARRVGRCSPEELTWAVAAASRRVPRATCLTQALALQALLGREGYESDLHIGVAKAPDGAFEAHAWLASGGRVLIGGGVERFTPLVSIGLPLR